MTNELAISVMPVPLKSRKGCPAEENSGSWVGEGGLVGGLLNQPYPNHRPVAYKSPLYLLFTLLPNESFRVLK